VNIKLIGHASSCSPTSNICTAHKQICASLASARRSKQLLLPLYDNNGDDNSSAKGSDCIQRQIRPTRTAKKCIQDKFELWAWPSVVCLLHAACLLHSWPWLSASDIVVAVATTSAAFAVSASIFGACCSLSVSQSLALQRPCLCLGAVGLRRSGLGMRWWRPW